MQLQTDEPLVHVEIVQGLDLAVADALADCSRVSDRRQQRNDHQDMNFVLLGRLVGYLLFHNSIREMLLIYMAL